MTLELSTTALFRGFSVETPSSLEFSPSGRRLAFCSPQGALCVAELSDALDVRTMSPPGGHFVCTLSWESEELLWVGISNGHVVQLAVTKKGDISIADWLTYRFPSEYCVQRIVRLHLRYLIAVCFADRVEIWRRRGVGSWTFEAVLHAAEDTVDNIWSLMSDTIAVHYRRRGLCYWNHTDKSETTGELCSNDWVSPGYRVAFNDKEELFASVDGQTILVYFLDKVYTQGLSRARIRRREAYHPTMHLGGIRSLSLVSAGASSYLALGMKNKLDFYTVHTAHHEDSLKLASSHAFENFDDTPKIAYTSGSMTRVAIAGTVRGVGVITAYSPGSRSAVPASCELAKSPTKTVEYSSILRAAFRRRKRRAQMAFVVRGAASLAALGASLTLGLKNSRERSFSIRLPWTNSTHVSF